MKKARTIAGVAVMAFLAAVLISAVVFGCALVKTDVAKLEGDVKAINWSEVSTYWADFVKGLNEALPVAETLFPGTKSTIETIVKPVLADANTAATALTTSVQAYQNGTLTTAALQQAAAETQSAVQAASAIVGQAVKGKLATGAVAASSVPTVATPAGSSK